MTLGLMQRGTAVPSRSGARPDGNRPVAPSRILLVFGILGLLFLLGAAFLDVPLAEAAARLSPQARRVAAVLSALGNSGYMLVSAGVLAILAYGMRRRGRAMTRLGERAAFVFASVASSGLLAQCLKHLVGRARPGLIGTMGAFHFDLFSIKASLASFPSGHTASAFGLALALGLMERRLLPALLIVAGLVGVSRVALGAHYPSDVVAGALLGSGVTVALAAAFARRGLAFAPAAATGLRPGEGA